MLTFTAASNCFFLSACDAAALNSPPSRSSLLAADPGRGRKARSEARFVSAAAVRVSGVPGFSNSIAAAGQGWCWRCKAWDGEGDWELEAEILEFMKNSENPLAFPTKKQLVDAGRMELVEAISRKRDWLSWGWDSNDEGDERGVVGVEGVSDSGLEISTASGERGNGDWEIEALNDRVSSMSDDSSQLATSSGRLLESEDDMGIEGILSRLEKQRNVSLGLKERENGSHVSSNCVEKREPRTPYKVADLKRSKEDASLSPNRGKHNNSLHKLAQNGSLIDLVASINAIKPDTWRTWSIQRARSSDTEFEVGEISFNKERMGGAMDFQKDKVLSMTKSAGENIDRLKELSSSKEINPCQIRNHLQQLESELSSVLHLLRSKTEETDSQKADECSLESLHMLSDAWEFQENEVMNAQNCLRSVRAKLAVLEGKMALTIIDAQKIVEEKQKRIEDARKALQFLRDACIVWPNSASEVLLVGSYDGWATQRKMEKSNTGVFYMSLKLYPGRYEIKFVVDGIWTIDPLRPTVNNNGFENNLLIIA